MSNPEIIIKVKFDENDYSREFAKLKSKVELEAAKSQNRVQEIMNKGNAKLELAEKAHQDKLRRMAEINQKKIELADQNHKAKLLRSQTGWGSKMLKSMQSVAFGVKAMVAAFAVNTIKNSISDTISWAGEMKDSAEAVGLTVEQLSALDFAVKTVGGDTGKLNLILTNLNDQLLEARKDSGSAQGKLFKEFGIDAQQDISKITNELIKNGDVYKLNQLLGEKQANVLIRLHNAYGSLEEITRKATDSGVVLSAESAEKLDMLGDKLDIISTKVKIFAGNLLLTPIFKILASESELANLELDKFSENINNLNFDQLTQKLEELDAKIKSTTENFKESGFFSTIFSKISDSMIYGGVSGTPSSKDMNEYKKVSKYLEEQNAIIQKQNELQKKYYDAANEKSILYSRKAGMIIEQSQKNDAVITKMLKQQSDNKTELTNIISDLRSEYSKENEEVLNLKSNLGLLNDEYQGNESKIKTLKSALENVNDTFSDFNETFFNNLKFLYPEEFRERMVKKLRKLNNGNDLPNVNVDYVIREAAKTGKEGGRGGIYKVIKEALIDLQNQNNNLKKSIDESNITLKNSESNFTNLGKSISDQEKKLKLLSNGFLESVKSYNLNSLSLEKINQEIKDIELKNPNVKILFNSDQLSYFLDEYNYLQNKLKSGIKLNIDEQSLFNQLSGISEYVNALQKRAEIRVNINVNEYNKKINALRDNNLFISPIKIDADTESFNQKILYLKNNLRELSKLQVNPDVNLNDSEFNGYEVLFEKLIKIQKELQSKFKIDLNLDPTLDGSELDKRIEEIQAKLNSLIKSKDLKEIPLIETVPELNVDTESFKEKILYLKNNLRELSKLQLNPDVNLNDSEINEYEVLFGKLIKIQKELQSKFKIDLNIDPTLDGSELDKKIEEIQAKLNSLLESKELKKITLIETVPELNVETDIFSTLNLQRTKLNDFMDRYSEAINLSYGLVNSLIDRQSVLLNNTLTEHQIRMDSINSEWTAESDRLRAMGLEYSTFYQNRLKNYQNMQKKMKDQELNIQSDIWEANQESSRTKAIMDAALASIKAFAQYGWPYGAIVAGLTAAATAIQINTINAQKNPYKKYALGGVVEGNGFSDSVPVLVTPGERIIDRYTAKANEDVLNRIDSGKPVDSSPNVYVNISGTIIDPENWFKKYGIKAINNAIRDGYSIGRN